MRIVLIALGLIAFLLIGSLYIVNEREQVLVLRFGEPIAVITEPGIYLKRPYMLENVVRLDRRILHLNADPQEVIASDQKRLIADAFAKYRITDPLKFYQTVRNERTARTRLMPILDSRLREVLGRFPLVTLLSDQRREMMQTIRDNLNREAETFGIEVVDVRIMRADLPKENSDKIYRRMQTEREREAKELRAEGAEEAKRITSRADKERTVMLAEAEKQSQMLRGQGDAEATRIAGEAYGRDLEFYRFYRSLQAYRQTLSKEDTTMVLSPDSEFLQFFNDMEGR